jgi:hypothetical protein
LRDSISKITRRKWAGGVAQAVECLLWKHKALSSNPSPVKKKKKTLDDKLLQKECLLEKYLTDYLYLTTVLNKKHRRSLFWTKLTPGPNRPG